MGAVETHHTVHQAASTDDDETAIKAIVYSYYKAVNDSRWDDVVAYFHSDATLHVPGQEPKVGTDEIRRFYEAHGRHAVKHHDDVPLLMTDGNRVMTLIDFHGVDVRGNQVQYWNGGIFTLDGKRFRQYRVIFDTAELPEWIRSKKGRRRAEEATSP